MRIVTSSRAGWTIFTDNCTVVLNRKRRIVMVMGIQEERSKLPSLNSGTPSTFKQWALKTNGKPS